MGKLTSNSNLVLMVVPRIIPYLVPGVAFYAPLSRTGSPGKISTADGIIGKTVSFFKGITAHAPRIDHSSRQSVTRLIYGKG